jgi:hypothetical protein
VINGMHVTLYSSPKQANALRTFLRDTLKVPSFDAGGGWLIFALPGEIAPHPDDDAEPNAPPTPDLGFSCENLEKTVAELKKRRVKFVMEIKDEGWGLRARFQMPGGLEADLYEPRYRKPKAR